MKYKAFISYSHKDEKFTRWLHTELENYKIPKELYIYYPNLSKSLFPIFRDREELPTSSNLKKEILKALYNSKYLIVICSTHSAKSKYVNEEIINFKRIHGEDKVHAVIINGEPHAKESDKFDDDLECFPEALKYKIINGKLSNIPTEPIAGDFRKGKDGKEYGKLKLIAGLLGVGFDELNQREKQREKKKRLFWNIFITIIVSTISSFIVYIKMLEKSVVDMTMQIDKLEYQIKHMDKQNNYKKFTVLNNRLKDLKKINKENKRILDIFGILKGIEEITPKALNISNSLEIKITTLNKSDEKIDNFKETEKKVSDDTQIIKGIENNDYKAKNNATLKDVNTTKNKITNFKSNEEIKTINPPISNKKTNITKIKIIEIKKDKLSNEISTLLIELASKLYFLEKKHKENTHEYTILKSLLKEILTLKEIFFDIEKCKKYDNYFYEDKKFILDCLYKELEILEEIFLNIKEIKPVSYQYSNYYDIELSFILHSYKKAIAIINNIKINLKKDLEKQEDFLIKKYNF